MKVSHSRILSLLLGAGLVGVAGAGLASATSPKSDLPPAKQALEDYAQQHQLAAPIADKAKDPGPPTTDRSGWVPDTGMLGQVNAPISGTTFSTVNAWAGWTSPTTWVIVYAGGPSDDITSGLIYITRVNGQNGRITASSASTGRLVPVPAANGALHVVRVDAGIVIVANPAGVEFRFNPLSMALG